MRLKRIEIAGYLLEECFRQDAIHNGIRIVKGMPANAKLNGVELIDFGRIVALTFQHDSFDDVPEGASIPVMNCEIQHSHPVSNHISGMTQDERQSLYEQLYDQYGCRMYK